MFQPTQNTVLQGHKGSLKYKESPFGNTPIISEHLQAREDPILENLQAIPSVFMHNLKIRNWFQVGSQSLNCCI